MKTLLRALVVYAGIALAQTFYSSTLALAQADASQIPLALVQVVGSDPAILTLKPTATFESFSLVPGTMTIRTSGTEAWPAVAIEAGGEPAQAGTLWVFLKIDGQWYATGAERLRPSQLNGGKPEADAPGAIGTLIGEGWLYDAGRWGPMAGYNPDPGETVGLMVVAGSTRSDNNTPLKARTNIIAVEWPGLAGAAPVPFAAPEEDPHLRAIRDIKAALVAKGTDLSGPCGAFEITKRVAWALKGEGAGVLSKPSGNNCDGFATDIILYPDGRAFDILTDGGGANGPTWNAIEPIDPTRYRAATDPGDGPPVIIPPSIPPVDLTPLLARLLDLESAVTTLRAQMVAAAGQADATAQSVNSFEARLAAAEAAIARIDAYLATRPIPTKCRASVLGIPVSCSVQ